MIERLLRLFPQYRKAEATIRLLADTRTHQDDEVRRLRATVEDLQAQVRSALEDGRHIRETVADWLAQRAGGRAIFGPNVELPEPTPQEMSPMQPRIHGRDLVRRLERVALEELSHEPTDRTPAA